MKQYCCRFMLFVFSMACVATCTANGTVQAFDFAKQGPLAFLSYLRENKSQTMVTMREPILDWIKAEHVPALFEVLNSKEECASVTLLSSSRIRSGSTVGDEAALLIAGYRAKQYPAELHSRPVDDSEKKAIRDWWMSQHRNEQASGR